MADSPLSEPPSGAGDGGLPPLNSLDPIPLRPSAVQPSAILEVLREEIAGGTRDLNAISAAIAKVHGIQPENVILGSGSGELLRAAVSAFTSRERALVMPATLARSFVSRAEQPFPDR